ncbi:MAG: DUF302 domain-containing protein [Peptostreptococcaceae bacterium]|nr:DUF302 domain-containing protein [Peptostreptococcaceae bacterium]
MDIQYKIQSGRSYADTLVALKEELAKEQFGVLWELNFKDKLQEKGLEFNTNFTVMEACNPGKAKDVLDKNIEAGYFLPCKVVVYEKDQSVWMGMLKPTSLVAMLDQDDLYQVANEVETTIKTAMEHAK